MRQRLIGLTLLKQQQGDFRVGREVVRIHLQLLIELNSRLVQFSGGFQCLPVKRVHPGHPRIEFHGVLQMTGGRRQFVAQ